ncbi:hypothetical protein [Actinokineospora sp.]|uniref:hypothetical protein n=1 Tax=Actinokineospora sp. TaxID=1872133 RepID=UPI00403778A3
MPDEQFTSKTTVARYATSLDDLSPAERAKRLATLSDFAAYVERDPDQMIAEVFDEQTRKYRKRGFYTDKAKEFAATYDEPRNAQLQRSNIIRAFFIANGRRLLPEQPDWMRT